MNSRQRYKAFISYSHHDRKAAEWLHRSLESYRPPAGLRAGLGEASGNALKPIFRDRDELSAAADLSEAILDALDRSDTLIILCSSHAATSRWVDKEVAHFLALRGADHVISVIAPGAPEGLPLMELLPPALRAALPEGVEPLAVDLRQDADGRRLAKLKIAARLLGVSLDRLVQRDARRRLRLMTAVSGVALAITVGMGAMTVLTLKSRQIAREQRDETEALVAYMLGDLREQLEPVGRLDLLDGVSAKVLAYYAKAQSDQLDDKALAQRAKAQTLLGTIREQRGDLEGAQDAFAQAAATTHALVERSPNDGDRVFDEAQNVFWLAYMEWRRGEIAQAERGFKRYAELAQRLVVIDPNRADWRIEVAYAKNNLGTLLFEEGRAGEALASFRAAFNIFEAERLRAPTDKQRLMDSANARAWVADSLLLMAKPREAFAERKAAAELLAKGEAAFPTDQRLAAKSVATQLGLARLELDLGRVAEARSRSKVAMNRLRELAALDPTNTRWREYVLVGELDLIDFAIWSGQPVQARSLHAAALANLARTRKGQEGGSWRPDLDGRLARQAVVLALSVGDVATAKRAAESLVEALETSKGDRETAFGRTDLLGLAQLVDGKPSAAIKALSPRRNALPPASLDVLARAYAAVGERETAARIVRDLKQEGYAHPGFVAFWRESPAGGPPQSGVLK
ncbi:TIR domain-containing protein [Caulobacter sp. SL161]|uniref:TIR domain-containing protein n=1 Tax=Caulobacter sp. SL161 TaxID=2995156 RepID=UPI00227391B7|nr:TIR domain-containing protein [Caulobacter sp. SL161]MCY1647409.1 TIR domain-containing protein [Caulobacter sp. SL161]